MATIVNSGNQSSFFQSEQTNPSGQNLAADQIDPAQPQVTGLVTTSDPVIPSAHSSVIVSNFDPNIYNLSQSSHLMRLIKALTGSTGISGLKKQLAINRLATGIVSARFVDVDSFYGSLFSVNRLTNETIQDSSGNPLDARTDVATADDWDAAQGSDARYRSRIVQLAKAIGMGGTYVGLKAVAEAVLSCEVDLNESWVKSDLLSGNSLVVISGLTYLAMTNQYNTYGNINNIQYGTLEGGQFGNGQTPDGNRGELIFTPHRSITIEEQYQLAEVLRVLKPSGTQITIDNQKLQTYVTIPVRAVAADSEFWSIESTVTPKIGLTDPASGAIYPTGDGYSSPRPAMSGYSGEEWTYNSRILKTRSYQMTNNFQTISTDDQVVTFLDGTNKVYNSGDAVMDKAQALSVRLSGDGVVAAYPYSPNR